jgi:formylglycine-generating enzyme required for sulfatase activity
MGSDRNSPEEAPVHRVTVDNFCIDRTPVTNRDFRKFVNETSYVSRAWVTVGEVAPGDNCLSWQLIRSCNDAAGEKS